MQSILFISKWSSPMRLLHSLPALALTLLTCHLAIGQAAPATKPDNATGQCKDGSYSTAASKSGACRGHKGVKDWYAAPTAPAANAAPAVPTATDKIDKPVTSTVPVAPSPSTQVKTQTQAAAQSASQSDTPPATVSIAPAAPSSAAASGGPGMVWLNTSSNVYHCPGTRYYGKTKAGSYISEADAKAKGARPERSTGCSK
jgi:hypothetical protein